jgi:hypothetical protein
MTVADVHQAAIVRLGRRIELGHAHLFSLSTAQASKVCKVSTALHPLSRGNRQQWVERPRFTQTYAQWLGACHFVK